MNFVGKQNTFWLALILGASLLFGAFSLCGSMPTFAYGAPAGIGSNGSSAQAQHTDASTASQDVEVSSEGSSARASGIDFALSDFSRVEKGSNRPIEGTYQGYCYLMDAPADSLCLVDLSGVVVVYVPEALAKKNGLDLGSEQTQANLKLLFSALDSYDAQGNSIVKSDAEWLFTSKQTFTTHGFTIGFSQEYKPGYFYTSVQTETGADVMGEESPLATDANLRLSHVDYANLQASDTVAIAAAPSAFEQLGSFFQTLDWSPLLVTLKTTGTAIIFIFILGLLAAWWTLRLKPRTQSIMDAIFTIPMVLPPTVCGFLLLMFLGRNTPVGAWFDQIGFPLVFSWQATVIAAVVVAFPLMYRLGARRLRVDRRRHARCCPHARLERRAHLLPTHAATCLVFRGCWHHARLRTCARRVRRNALSGGQLCGHHAHYPHRHLLRMDGWQHRGGVLLDDRGDHHLLRSDLRDQPLEQAHDEVPP